MNWKKFIEYLIEKRLPGYRLTKRKLRKDAGVKRKKIKAVYIDPPYSAGNKEEGNDGR
jgi:16S rRNA G966 N2-methylase RsmD